ncbi:CoA-transferase family III [Aspergillus terreus]|uniref:CoA-transferase family III n=1 Tax=Aspergillus terreus TaxID=33178 RepID=A0A5M3YR72_ASPTE|nr:hypothetical protein ATETN484_0002038200 [Aspergillus terreus]GFF15238.1 CoA-transferase family III [Aspergillus terreus]
MKSFTRAFLRGHSTSIAYKDGTIARGPFCTQILGDLGAEVIKVEQPNGGDETRLWKEPGEERLWKEGTQNMSLYFNTVNRNKKSITINLKHQLGKKVILGLIKTSDVVVDNFIPGKLEEFGLGIWCHWSLCAKARLRRHSSPASAGLLHITGEQDGPPTKLGVGIMDLCTGLYLHGSICAALVARARTGQGQKIDASLFETTISILNNVGMSWLNLGKEGKRWGTAHPCGAGYWRCRKESVLKKTTDRLNSLVPGTCEYIVADLKDQARCDHLINEVKTRRMMTS